MKRTVHNLKRFGHIWRINLKARLMTRLEFRMNFFMMIIGSTLQFITFAAGIKFVFGYADMINGWTFSEALLVAASFFLVDGILWSFFGQHMSMSKLVREGILDYIVIRPIDSQFSVSTYRGDPEDWIRIIVSLFAMHFALKGIIIDHPIYSGALFVVAISIATAIFYSISLAINSMALFYTQTWGVWNLFESFVRLGQYPADIYSQKFVKIILYSLIPIAFLGTVPANMLRGEMKLGLLLAGLTVAIFFLAASRKFWLYAVRNYSSASS